VTPIRIDAAFTVEQASSGARAQGGSGQRAFKARVTGLEPASEFAANVGALCGCENCLQCCAARALHSECFKRHYLASLDSDLQKVINAWERLPVTLREAVSVLVVVAQERPV
jgi:hypothetical protein